MGAAPYLAPTGLLPTSARTSGGKVTVVISWQLRASSTNHAGRATRCTNRRTQPLKLSPKRNKTPCHQGVLFGGHNWT